MATGRSDYPNQINNVLCFPGLFKGAFSCLARTINKEMKLAGANFDFSVTQNKARSVRDAAIASGVVWRELVIEMNQDAPANKFS